MADFKGCNSVCDGKEVGLTNYTTVVYRVKEVMCHQARSSC